MKKERESGIELLKIIAMLMIVINHVTQTLCEFQPGATIEQSYLTNIKCSYTNLSHFPLVFFRYFGAIGNDLFFISSVWFLSNNTQLKIKKALKLVFNTWIVSIVLLLGFLVFSPYHVSFSLIIKSIFPTTFSNNWYLTCYLIIFIIHPYINKLLLNTPKKEYRLLLFVFCFIYLFMSLIKGDLFFSNNLVVFMVIYCLVVYLKLYHFSEMNNIRYNIIILIISIMSLFALCLFTNYAGLKISVCNNRMLHWGKSSNPLIILIALSLFNLFRQLKIKNRIVNYISSLTLFIYLIHENILVRMYLRPYYWSVINPQSSFEKCIWTIIYSIILFVVSTVLAAVFKLFCDCISSFKTQKTKKPV